jgi:predicted  nucleic acid-binding Zn-ribbon protein
VDDALQGLNKEVAADRAMFTQQVEATLAQLRNLDTSIEVAKMAALGSQRRVDKQDELIAEFRAQLVEAQQERANLAQQVTEFSAQVIQLQQAPSRSSRRVSRAKEK